MDGEITVILISGMGEGIFVKCGLLYMYVHDNVRINSVAISNPAINSHKSSASYAALYNNVDIVCI